MIFNFLLLLLFSIDYQTDRKSQTTNNSGQGPKAPSLMRAQQVSSPADIGKFTQVSSVPITENLQDHLLPHESWGYMVYHRDQK